MKNKIILHIPHSSTNIPFMDGYIVKPDVLTAEILKLTDWFTDELFFTKGEENIVANFSRVFCDPERFADDKQEVMAQYGMGVLYEKSDDGKTIRKVTAELRNKILSNYYYQHHNNLNEAVNNQLKQFGKALILDCHSFPNQPFIRDLDQSSPRPDFNIGTDSFHTPQKLIDLSVEFFKDTGYTLGIDWPYKGSIVPLEHYQKNKNVQSIMLEINRKLYLKEPSNEKSENYSIIKELIKKYIKLIKSSL